tara:strand:+ start:529 stop:825 length:297 start_codon:yes stop_codon:yes gene_type:complete
LPENDTIANLAKGGVTKVFERADGHLLLNDCGTIGRLASGEIVPSQWIDPDTHFEITQAGWKVQGRLNLAPMQEPFTLGSNILFRLVLALSIRGARLG